MMTRRDRRVLERAITEARGPDEQALARYNLAVFHDNNSREAEAIPHYEEALRLGLDDQTRAKALAWLASSLYKTNRPREALDRIREALSITEEPELVQFLSGLQRRIQARMRRCANAAV